MRGRRLWKFCLWAFGYSVVLLIGWLALPTPSPSNETIQAQFQAGKPISRVYDGQSFYPWKDEEMEKITGWVSNFATSFQLQRDSRTGKQVIIIGDSLIGGMKNVTVPIYEEGNIDPIELSLRFNVTMRKSESDGGPVPPWVGWADTAMLNWWTSYTKSSFPLRTRRIPANGSLEIWPDSSDFKWPYGPQHMPAHLKPLVVIQASGSGDPFRIIFPHGFGVSATPSVMYPVRLVILALLAPVMAVVMLFTGFILPITLSIVSFVAKLALIAVGAGVVYAVFLWMKNGRPDIDIKEVVQAVTDALKELSAKKRRETSSDDENAESSVLIDLEAEANVISTTPIDDQNGSRRRS